MKIPVLKPETCWAVVLVLLLAMFVLSATAGIRVSRFSFLSYIGLSGDFGFGAFYALLALLVFAAIILFFWKKNSAARKTVIAFSALILAIEIIFVIYFLIWNVSYFLGLNTFWAQGVSPEVFAENNSGILTDIFWQIYFQAMSIFYYFLWNIVAVVEHLLVLPGLFRNSFSMLSAEISDVSVKFVFGWLIDLFMLAFYSTLLLAAIKSKNVFEPTKQVPSKTTKKKIGKLKHKKRLGKKR
ncbi:MAG: hypothetical protein WC308_03585 [archaeon]|jgi:hypothetical protein